MTNYFNKYPLVSILIPAFNAEKYIRESIESVLNQTYINLEIIICDDASIDHTLDILNEYVLIDHRINVVKNEKNLGYLKTFNKLLGMATGEFITFLDADDIMPNQRIEKQLYFLLENPQVGLVGTNYGRITNNGKIYFRSKLPLSDQKIKEEIKHDGVFPFCGSSVMIRKEIVKTIGGYRDYFDQCPGEDIDWIRRISEKYKVSNIDYLGYLYRFSTTSLTRKPQFKIKARHIRDIITFLANQRDKNFGIDDLMRDGGQELKDFENKLKLPYQKDPSLLFRKVSLEYSIQKGWKNSFKFSLRALQANPLKFNNYLTLFLIFPLLLIPSSFLLYVKNILNVNHVSDKI